MEIYGKQTNKERNLSNLILKVKLLATATQSFLKIIQIKSWPRSWSRFTDVHSTQKWFGIVMDIGGMSQLGT